MAATVSVHVRGKTFKAKQTDEGLVLRLSGKRIASISEIEGLSKLVDLRELILDFNAITNIEGLYGLGRLRVLNLDANQVTRIRGLESLAGLERLSLENNHVTMIEGLDQLARLQGLSLGCNQISKIEGLNKLTSLRGLYLNGNRIAKIEGLDQLTNLRELDLSLNPVYPQIAGKLAQDVVRICQTTVEQEISRPSPEARPPAIEPSKALIGMIKLQNSVDVNEAAQLLHMAPGDVKVLLFSLAADDKVKGQFRGDIFQITSDVDAFIAALDQQFRQWDAKEKPRQEKSK